MSEYSVSGQKTVQKVKKLWKNGVFRSVFFIVIVVVGVLAFRQGLILLLRTEYPLQTPVSGSMRPTLNEGDLLIVQGGYSGEEIFAHLGDGDIIVFRSPRNPDDFIVHRAVDKYELQGKWYIVTKGDNNGATIDDINGIDSWSMSPPGGIYNKPGVPESYLIGKVIWHVPYLGYVKIYLGTPTGLLITALLIVIFLLVENLVSDSREKKMIVGDTKNKNDERNQPNRAIEVQIRPHQSPYKGHVYI